MADAGVPLHNLRKVAGHGTLTTTRRYRHPDRQSLTNAGELLLTICGPQMVLSFELLMLAK